MKYFVALSFFYFVTTFSRADKTEEANKYIDEVLSVHFPRAIHEAELEVFQMPEFENNFQTRSHDGTATTGKLLYHSGILTGLQNVYRKVCSNPEWTSGNLTFYCDIVFPQITVNYEGRVRILTSNSNNGRNHQFSVTGNTTDMEARIEISASPYLKIPAMKRLTILSNGKPSFQFDVLKEVPYEILSSHFFSKYHTVFRIVFNDLYSKTFEQGIESLPYPF